MNAFVSNVMRSGCFALDKRRKSFFASDTRVAVKMRQTNRNVTVCIPFMKGQTKTLVLCLDRYDLLKSVIAEEVDGCVFFVVEMDILRLLKFTEEQLRKLADDDKNFHIIKPASGNLSDFCKGVSVNVVSLNVTP